MFTSAKSYALISLVLVSGAAVVSSIHAGTGLDLWKAGALPWNEAFLQEIREGVDAERKLPRAAENGRYSIAVVDGGNRVAVLDTREGFLVFTDVQSSGIDAQREIESEIIMKIPMLIMDSMSTTLTTPSDSLRFTFLLLNRERVAWQVSRNGDGRLH